MGTVLLPPVVNPIAVDIIYHNLLKITYFTMKEEKKFYFLVAVPFYFLVAVPFYSLVAVPFYSLVAVPF